jgi:hypothetical protein
MPYIILTVCDVTMQLRESGFAFRGVNLMLLPTTTCCSHDTPLFRMSTLEICTGRHFISDCLSCQPTTGWWSTSSSGGDAPADVSTLTTLPVSVTCFSKKFVGISCGDVNFLNWNKYVCSPTLCFTVTCKVILQTASCMQAHLHLTLNYPYQKGETPSITTQMTTELLVELYYTFQSIQP